MLEIETLNTFDTELSADSIEWCKTEGYQHFFSCGTYQLNADEQQAKTSRKGRVYLFSYDVETKELVKCQQIETDAILDQKWGECNQVRRGITEGFFIKQQSFTDSTSHDSNFRRNS